MNIEKDSKSPSIQRIKRTFFNESGSKRMSRADATHALTMGCNPELFETGKPNAQFAASVSNNRMNVCIHWTLLLLTNKASVSWSRLIAFRVTAGQYLRTSSSAALSFCTKEDSEHAETAWKNTTCTPQRKGRMAVRRKRCQSDGHPPALIEE